MIAERLATAYAQAYARHAGLDPAPMGGEVRRRLARMEPWARALTGLSCAAALWAAPLAFLGRPRSLASLEPADRERLLHRLLRCRPPLRAFFLAARSVALAACYSGRGR